MNIALVMTAVTLGAVVANYCEVTELHKDDESGKLMGARVKDNLTGEEWNVRAKVCNDLEKYFLLSRPVIGYHQRHWSVFRCTAHTR